MPEAAGAALTDADSELDELLADLASVVRAAVADQPGDQPATALTGLADSAPVRALLTEVIEGDTLAVLAWQSERGECDTRVMAGNLPVEARPDGDGLVLSGSVSWVPTDAADAYLVAARSAGEIVLVRVDRGTRGMTVAPQRAADGTRWARLDLDGVRLPGSAVLGSGTAARDALNSAVDTGTLVCSAELLGLIDRMLELTLSYLSTRRQFGRPIGSFQALRHRAVDLWVQQRLTSAAVHSALRRACSDGVGPDTLALAASSAKSRASSAALRVGNEAVQLHGAIGFTDEYELGRYVNRALVLAAWLGNARAHTRRHGRLAAEVAVAPAEYRRVAS